MFFANFLRSISKLTMSSMKKPAVVFVLGGPGAGKGTQCANIVKEYGFVHLSAGDLLRAERNKPGSRYGEMIEEHIRNGGIVPVEVTCSLIEKVCAQRCLERGAAGSGRSDDNPESLKKRFQTYMNDTMQIIKFYEKRNLVCRVDASKPPDEVK
uniref:Adenylate kinase n=2 Tax=Timema TaxID=61471 RepID=A0A7R9E785_9NEOP|nr:unnamed protein product [Timema cristinae]CAD7428356.1 unnamed protein product [Timema monikensis]